MAISFKSCPTFGYEYESCNANLRRCQEMRGKVHGTTADLEQMARIRMWASNFFKVLGAFVPVVGIGRIIYAVAKNDVTLGREALRGLAELLGAGLFMIAIDVGVTIYREYKHRYPDYQIV